MLKLQFGDELAMVIKDDFTATVKFHDGIFYDREPIEKLLKALDTNLPECVIPIVKNKLDDLIESYVESLRDSFDCALSKIDTHAKLIKDDE